MKTEYQIQNYLLRQGVKSASDFGNIQTFLFKLGVLIHHLDINKAAADGATFLEFLTWFEKGCGDGEVALYNGRYTVVTKTGRESSHVSSFFTPDGKYEEGEEDVPTSQLKNISPADQLAIEAKLSRMGLEYSTETNRIDKKRIPPVNERVMFYNPERRGLGVIRNVDVAANEVELYCYYIYDDGSIGFSMHETGVVTFHEYHFVPMSYTERRRFKNELAKHGKVWKDRLHRIELKTPRAAEGGQYWYITSEMKLVSAKEDNGMEAQLRYRSGNYFTSVNEGLVYLEKVSEMLRARLTQ